MLMTVFEGYTGTHSVDKLFEGYTLCTHRADNVLEGDTGTAVMVLAKGYTQVLTVLITVCAKGSTGTHIVDKLSDPRCLPRATDRGRYSQC